MSTTEPCMRCGQHAPLYTGPRRMPYPDPICVACYAKWRYVRGYWIEHSHRDSPRQRWFVFDNEEGKTVASHLRRNEATDLLALKRASIQ